MDLQFLSHYTETQLFLRPNFVSLICWSIDRPLSHQKSLSKVASSPGQAQLLGAVGKALKLSVAKEVAFSLALTNSNQADLRKSAEQHLKQKFNEWIDKVNAANSRELKVPF